MNHLDVMIVTFSLGTQRLGVKASLVREFLLWAEPRAVEKAPAYLLGILDYKGGSLPLIDLSARLGWGSIEAGELRLCTIIVVETSQGLQGLVVTQVEGIAVLPAQMTVANDAEVPLSSDQCDGIAEIDTRRIGVLALDRLACPEPVVRHAA